MATLTVLQYLTNALFVCLAGVGFLRWRREHGTARRALADRLPLRIALAAWAFVDGPLRDNPQRVGHALRAPFEGHWSARRGTYRVRHRVDEGKHAVVVLDIAPRADAYQRGGPERSPLRTP